MPYQEPLVPLLYAGEPDGFASEFEIDASMPVMVSETSEGEEQSDGADPLVDFCDLRNKPARFQNYSKDKKASKC